MDGATTTSRGRVTNSLYTLSKIYVRTKKPRTDDRGTHAQHQRQQSQPHKVSPHRKLPPLMRRPDATRVAAPAIEGAFEDEAELYWEAPPPRAAAVPANAQRKLGDIGRPSRRVAYGEDSNTSFLEQNGDPTAPHPPPLQHRQAVGGRRRGAAPAASLRRQAIRTWAEVVRKIVVQQRVVGAFLNRNRSLDGVGGASADRRAAWASIVQKLRIYASGDADLDRSRRAKGPPAAAAKPNGYRRRAAVGSRHEIFGGGPSHPAAGKYLRHAPPQQQQHYLDQHYAAHRHHHLDFEQQAPQATVQARTQAPKLVAPPGGFAGAHAFDDKRWPAGSYTLPIADVDHDDGYRGGGGESWPPGATTNAHRGGAALLHRAAPPPPPPPPPPVTKLQQRFSREMTLVGKVNASDHINLQVTGFATPRHAVVPNSSLSQQPALHHALVGGGGSTRTRRLNAGSTSYYRTSPSVRLPQPTSDQDGPAGEASNLNVSDDSAQTAPVNADPAKPAEAIRGTAAASQAARQRAAVAARLRARAAAKGPMANTLQVPHAVAMPTTAPALPSAHSQPALDNQQLRSRLPLADSSHPEPAHWSQTEGHSGSYSSPFIGSPHQRHLGSPPPRHLGSPPPRRLGSPAPRRLGSPPPRSHAENNQAAATDGRPDSIADDGEITLIVPVLSHIGAAARAATSTVRDDDAQPPVFVIESSDDDVGPNHTAAAGSGGSKSHASKPSVERKASVASVEAISVVADGEPVVIITDVEGQSVSAPDAWPISATRLSESRASIGGFGFGYGFGGGHRSSATDDRESGYLSAPSSSKLSERSKSRTALSRLSTITSSSGGGGLLGVPPTGADSRAHSPALSVYSETAALPSPRSVSRFTAASLSPSSSARFLEVPSVNLADMDAPPTKSRFPAIAGVSASQTDLASNAESDADSITIPLPVIGHR